MLAREDADEETSASATMQQQAPPLYVINGRKWLNTRDFFNEYAERLVCVLSACR